MAPETIGYGCICGGQAVARRPLRRPYLKATAATSKGLVAQIPVERHYHQMICERVLNQSLIVLGLNAGVPGAHDPVPSAIQKQDDGLDHVLVGEER